MCFRAGQHGREDAHSDHDHRQNLGVVLWLRGLGGQLYSRFGMICPDWYGKQGSLLSVEASDDDDVDGNKTGQGGCEPPKS